MSHENSNQGLEAMQSMRQLMCAVQERSVQLVRDIHPEWIRAALPNFDGLLSQCNDGPSTARMSHLLADYYNVQWPDFVLLQDKVNRITLLAAPAAKRVFAAAALYLSRGIVRRCIARKDRLALIDLVGEPAYVGIRDAADTGGLQLTSAIDHFEPDVWANKGYGLVQASTTSMCAVSSKIAQLFLAPIEMGDEADKVKSPSARYDLTEFIKRLDIFFPEQAWLFGLSMDQVLSE
jgi:Bacterial type III secretion protein (HrpB4)